MNPGRRKTQASVISRGVPLYRRGVSCTLALTCLEALNTMPTPIPSITPTKTCSTSKAVTFSYFQRQGSLSTNSKGRRVRFAVFPPVSRPGSCRKRLPEILNTHATLLADNGRVGVDNVTALVGVRVVTSAQTDISFGSTNKQADQGWYRLVPTKQ